MRAVDYNFIIEESVNEVYVFDAHTLKFQNVNRSGRENLGYTLAELQDMTPLDIELEFTPTTFAELIQPLNSGEEQKLVFTTDHRRKDNTTYRAEVHLQREIFDGHDVFVAIILDITEQTRFKNYIFSLNQIFNDSLNEIFIFDAVTLKFIEVNNGACQNLGYDIDELRQMTPIDIKPDMTAESFSALIIPLRLGQKEKLEFLTIHRRKDGTDYPVEVHLQLSMLNDVPVFVAIILDITERLNNEKRLQDERIRILNQFISDTSHEFRTPMSIINTKLYLLKKSLSDATLRNHLDVMQSQVDRIEDLIEGLHQLSQLDATDTIEVESVEILPLIKPLCERFTQQYQHKELFVEIDIMENMGKCDLNGEKLGTALFQIMKNAFDHTPKYGRIQVKAFVEDEILSIKVSNTGQGIADADQKRIFERLYRIDSSRNTETGGVGLGLTIARRCIELHHGHITVESQQNEGAIFCIELPIHHNQIKSLI